MLQTAQWGRRPVCGAALLCWVADAYRQSCSYVPLARDGGCNRAEPAYDCDPLSLISSEGLWASNKINKLNKKIKARECSSLL